MSSDLDNALNIAWTKLNLLFSLTLKAKCASLGNSTCTCGGQDVGNLRGSLRGSNWLVTLYAEGK